MLYDSASNSLLFAAGAVRPKAGSPNAVDYTNTWTYDLSKIGTPEAIWVAQSDIPYGANHIRYIQETCGETDELCHSIAFKLTSPPPALQLCYGL